MRNRSNGAQNGPTLEMVLADGNTYKYPGHFYVANRQVNVQTGTIKIQALFPIPTIFCARDCTRRFAPPPSPCTDALLVPQGAVLETQGQYQVAVVGADNRVSHAHWSRPASRSGDLRIIEEGSRAGERVITEGLQKVTDGMEVKPHLVPSAAARRQQSAPRRATATLARRASRQPELARCRSFSSIGPSSRWSSRFSS